MVIHSASQFHLGNSTIISVDEFKVLVQDVHIIDLDLPPSSSDDVFIDSSSGTHCCAVNDI